MTRRTIAGAGVAVLLLAGCSGEPEGPEPEQDLVDPTEAPGAPQEADPDEAPDRPQDPLDGDEGSPDGQDAATDQEG